MGALEQSFIFTISCLNPTRLKCKSSARVKIALKKDWIEKKCWENYKKKIKMSKKIFEKIGKNQKKSEKIGKNRKKSKKKNNQK